MVLFPLFCFLIAILSFFLGAVIHAHHFNSGFFHLPSFAFSFLPLSSFPLSPFLQEDLSFAAGEEEEKEKKKERKKKEEGEGKQKEDDDDDDEEGEEEDFAALHFQSRPSFYQTKTSPPSFSEKEKKQGDQQPQQQDQKQESEPQEQHQQQYEDFEIDVHVDIDEKDLFGLFFLSFFRIYSFISLFLSI